MDRSLLAARIQEILRKRPAPAGPESAEPASPSVRGAGLQSCPAADRAQSHAEIDEDAAFAARCAADEASSAVHEVLGGEVVEGPSGPCLVVDREYPASHVHGRHETERYATAAAGALHALPWFIKGDAGIPLPRVSSAASRPAGGAGDDPRLLFFDLETTGLSGGAGTYAFLVGCGWFDGSAFRTRQFFLRSYGEERGLLEAVREFFSQPSWLVTYNGRAFDVPLIDMRYLVHRRESPFSGLPHVDMLGPARRLWRRRLVGDGPGGRVPGWPPPDRDQNVSCALTSLEEDILGLARADDVPGWEIPSRFFAYARTGDARGLAAVLEHNRLDLLSLAAITGLILEMAVEQERVVKGRHDCLELARLLESIGRSADAERCYDRAASPGWPVEGERDGAARAEALRWLAVQRRRARRYGEAAEAWRSLLQIPGLDSDSRREACEALAIHHEHRAKDLDTARSFALRALDIARGGRFAPEVEHRLGRLDRKISAGGTDPRDAPASRLPDLPHGTSW